MFSVCYHYSWVVHIVMNEPMIIVWLGVSRVLQADKMECLEQTEECMCMKD